MFRINAGSVCRCGWILLWCCVVGAMGVGAQGDEGAAGDDWQARFDAIYGLEAGQVLKFIARPYPPERQKWYEEQNPSQAKSIPEGPEWLKWEVDEQGKGRFRGMMFSPPAKLSTVSYGIGVPSLFIDIEPELAKRELRGDWVLRKDATDEQIMAALEGILREQIADDVRVKAEQREMDSVVARGKFVEGIPRNPREGVIVVHEGVREYPDARGSQYDTQRFLERLQGTLRMPVIDEAEAARTQLIWAQFNGDTRLDKAGADKLERAERILEHLAGDIGLAFAIEKRMVRVWVIAREAQRE